ncbi:MAG: response regulator [Bacteroidales bacterium]|nr:response regulator [Bacteroidales bacterium]
MNKKILIVDDIFSNRLLLGSTLESIGVEYETVENGQLAIEFIQKGGFSMVLLDIEMPVMNGIETAKYIREEMDTDFCDIPIIALTAHNPDEYKNRMQEAGFNEILSKPYSVEKIEGIINKYSKNT